MVVSPDDMSDSHGCIVYHHGEIVRGKPITSQDDEVIQFRIVEFYTALNEIVHHRFPRIRREEADRKGFSWRKRFLIKASPVVFGFDPRLQRSFPLLLQFIRGTISA